MRDDGLVGAPRGRVRPGRAYALLGVFDVMIVGGLLGVGVAGGRVPTWGELGPVMTALTALVALNVGVITVNEKRVADARAAWWERAHWALQESTSENVRARMAGQLALAHLAQSDLVTDDDLQLLGAIPDEVIARVSPEDEADIMREEIQVVVEDEPLMAVAGDDRDDREDGEP